MRSESAWYKNLLSAALCLCLILEPYPRFLYFNFTAKGNPHLKAALGRYLCKLLKIPLALHSQRLSAPSSRLKTPPFFLLIFIFFSSFYCPNSTRTCVLSLFKNFSFPINLQGLEGMR